MAAVDALAEEIAVKSRAILSAHHKSTNRRKGTSPKIKVSKAGVDALVILEDPDGGALAIEFGRAGGAGVGAMAPIAPLRGAL